MNRYALAILAMAALELAFGGILRPRRDPDRAPAAWTFDGDWITTACIDAPRYDETWSFDAAPPDLESRVRSLAAQQRLRGERFGAALVLRLEERFSGIRVGRAFASDTLEGASPSDESDFAATDACLETLRDAASADAPIFTLTYDYADSLFEDCSVRGYALGVVIGSRFLGIYREERVRISQVPGAEARILVAHGILDAQLAGKSLLRVVGRPLAPKGATWSETVTRASELPATQTKQNAERRRGEFSVVALHGFACPR